MTPPSPTLAMFITQAAADLSVAGLEDSHREARFLVCQVLGISPLDVLVGGDKPLTAAEHTSVRAALMQRCQRKPLSKIVGIKEFYGLEFATTEAVLDPRPDSETLVTAALEFLQRPGAPAAPRILDLGTGSGCLLLTLLQALPEATGVGVDISPAALDVARYNAKRLGLDDRLTLVESFWWEGLHDHSNFTCIISNPPYIRTTDIPGLDPEVRIYDPLSALEGGEDGLAAYRLLAMLPKTLLNPMSHRVFFEIGSGQSPSVMAIMELEGFSCVSQIKDISGLVRCLEFVHNKPL